MTVLVGDEILKLFGDKVAKLQLELDCSRLQVTKYEVLSRTRGQRISELERLVVALQQAHSQQATTVGELERVKSDAESYIEYVLAENAELKLENSQVVELSAALAREQQISRQMELRYNDIANSREPVRKVSSWKNSFADTRCDVGISASSQTEVELTFSRAAQTE